jgi:hypothetical protein
MANPLPAPVGVHEIEKIRGDLMNDPSKEVQYAEQLKKMEEAFKGRGELSGWKSSVLDGIDTIFVECYTDADTQEISDSLFFPNSSDNNNRFHRYCLEVDQYLRERPDIVPPNCRQYFAYYTIWTKMGYEFPMPLGTCSVIKQLHDTAARYKEGFCEVSIHLSAYMS